MNTAEIAKLPGYLTTHRYAEEPTGLDRDNRDNRFPSFLDIGLGRRRQLFELGDLKRYPRYLKDALRAFLDCTHRVMPFHKLWAPLVARVAHQTGETTIVDLASGGGSLARILRNELQEKHDVAMRCIATDIDPVKYNAGDDASSPDFEYYREPVDATRVSANLRGIRTLMNGFHHFPRNTAREILGNAYKTRRPICVFEYTSNTLLGVMSALSYPIFNMLIAPFVRPFRWSYLFFTYVIPMIPFAIAFDGLMSNMRTYSVKELKAMTEDFSDETYEWSVGTQRMRGYPIGLTYCIGIPMPENS